jgi:3-oxoisoapionate decarboxylase
MELGISSWSLPWSIGVPNYPKPAHPLDELGLLDRARESEVKVVQIADNLPLDKLSGEQLDRLGGRAGELGLALEVGTRGLDPEHLGRYISIAQRIGARALRTVLSGSMLGRDQLAAAEEAIKAVTGALERQGVTLALENNEALSSAEFAGLMQRIGHPLVGMCLDTANSLGRPEELQSVVRNLAEHTVMLHAKDFDIARIDTRMGFSVFGAPVGDGRVDFGWVVSELLSHRRQEISVIVEHWPPFDTDIETTVRTEDLWLERSVAHLASIL